MIATALVLSALAAGPAPAASPPVRVRLVEASPHAAGRLVAATVIAAERATISTRLAARVVRVNAREGERVARGALLVSLDASDVRGQLAAARASLATARAHEKRVRALLAQKAATPAELEQAEAQRAQAEGAVAAAQASLGYSELRAPFDGVVQAKRVQEGDLVGPGQPLLELDGRRGLELQATLSEAEARGVAPGVKLPFDAGGVRGTAEVFAVAPGRDPVSHRVAIRARVDGAPEGLRSGAFARLELPSTGSGAVAVPRTALVERGDLTGAYVVEDGRARLRWLAVGEASGDRVTIRAGLKPGERVVAEPAALADGAAVEVADAR